MKKIIILLVFILPIGLFSGCSKQVKSSLIKQPSIEQVRSICDLATLECFYNNVAKSEKTAGTGVWHLWEKDRKFWFEYTGIAKIGIDMAKVNMKVDGENVTISIPNAKLLSIGIDEKSFNNDSLVLNQDGFNKNEITANEKTAAIDNAQKEMEKTVMRNTALLINAQDRAKELIENYIVNLGEISGIEYKIKWEYQKV
ncbi:DUF4230 domain-containing protein [Paludicola sp. MB14-C6]|uniref:DUF4230 domain-containing protein n=1 Tax=Paludihabitans sp. MB14-C6 TaxID=3070656 RepID=UPI0027DC3E6E|nr:DUF4230 domain-containing protein [Paludicola sp. MB14-C6]WMJ22886.1 DUF4230 domain-containing protein [Paludicola sp. MB14-C6]